MTTLPKDAIECISILQRKTGAHAVDCVINESVVFAIPSGQMGLAIGKGGENVRKLSQLFKKKVEIVEYSDDFNSFAKNLASPATPKKIELKDGVLYIEAEGKSKYLLKGDKGKLLKRMKLFLERHYGSITKVEVI